MPFMYDAVHNTIRHDGKMEIDDDALDERGILKDGKKVRVPVMFRDHNSVQQSVALEDAARRRAEDRDWQKAELSARWKAGLQLGDTFRMGDRNMVVSGRNPTNGKIQLADAEGPSAPGRNVQKQRAYDSYDRDIQSRYLNTRDAEAGGACTTSGGQSGTWRDKDGRLVCVTGKSSEPDEWALAGPLSDEERVKVKDEAYRNYDDQISNAWRR